MLSVSFTEEPVHPNPTRVYALWAKTGCFYPAKVVTRVGELYTVVFDDNTRCNVKLPEMRAYKLKLGDMVEVSSDEVVVHGLLDSGDVVVQQTGSARTFPVRKEQIAAHWDDRLLNAEAIVWLFLPLLLPFLIHHTLITLILYPSSIPYLLPLSPPVIGFTRPAHRIHGRSIDHVLVVLDAAPAAEHLRRTDAQLLPSNLKSALLRFTSLRKDTFIGLESGIGGAREKSGAEELRAMRWNVLSRTTLLRR
ncbi:hypothetical protein C8R47DRAFT_1228850 [Mycena vitilis]|nr:hypothetical protein C8R47DRAFT_1228850 [Mycena vitilis]